MTDYMTPMNTSPVGEMTYILLDRLHHARELAFDLNQKVKAQEQALSAAFRRLQNADQTVAEDILRNEVERRGLRL
jgi:cell division protein FtsL